LPPPRVSRTEAQLWYPMTSEPNTNPRSLKGAGSLANTRLSWISCTRSWNEQLIAVDLNQAVPAKRAEVGSKRTATGRILRLLA
jgi:hypothetical protein